MNIIEALQILKQNKEGNMPNFLTGYAKERLPVGKEYWDRINNPNNPWHEDMLNRLGNPYGLIYDPQLLEKLGKPEYIRTSGPDSYGVGWGEPDDQGVNTPPKPQSRVLGVSQASKIRALSPDEMNRYIDTYLGYSKRNNADLDYTRRWLETLMTQAPNYNLDPLVMAAISAYESGWGGTRHGNNLIGYGKTNSGDMGFNYENDPIASAVPQLLQSVASAYNGVYAGQTTPEGFVSDPRWKWNYNASWPVNVNATLRMILGR